MDLLGPLRKFDRHQQQSRWLRIPLAVVKKFGDDGAGSLAALVAYYAFFSLFPLLLVAVTVLGFVLQGDPSAQQSVKQSVLGQFPGIGSQISNGTLQGHSLALVIGIVTSLLAGLGVTQAAQNAVNQVWAVPRKRRPSFFGSRLRSLILLLSLGGLFLIGTLASGLVSGGLSGPLLTVLGILVSVTINFALFETAFKVLSAIDVSWRTLIPGALFAAIGWEALQVAGGIYIHHVVSKSTATYGTFALVIGVLAWLHLGAQLTLYGAEINVVLARRLYPRSLFGPPDTTADKKTLRALAEVEERHDEEQIEVEFQPPGSTEGDGKPPATTDRPTTADPPRTA
ncbi:MAG TPA: YihY/virulence factor BrkB family protein [Solirubrobacteraceae bacterium]|jgi:YihY family inner membrane protein|nr:YihY/virulence factor BrkB family protein [Solirubrobacteraceae bacterium]